MRPIVAAPAVGLALFAAPHAMAQVRAVPAQPESEAAALRGVEVFLLNEGEAPVEDAGPRRIEVTATDGTRLVLERAPGPTPSIGPHGFAKARYIPVAIAGTALPPAEQHPPAVVPPQESVAQSSTGSSAGLLERFEAHEPIYGAFGLKDAGGKLQFSFAFRPFAEDAPLKLGNLRFAYTQTMFWALNAPSGPFRSTNYSPELYVDAPFDETTRVALGWRHDSNGRGVTDSVDINRLFVRGEKTFDLGQDWHVDLAPQAWLYVGSSGTFHDMKDYFGYTGLTAAIRQKDGVKIALTGRGNFRTGKGAGELFVSYPMARLGGGLGIYLFGQAFTGYGEALDRYNQHDTHARLGIAFTR